MKDNVPHRRARAETPLRLAYATRILTMPEQPMPSAAVPEPAVLAGQVLFVPVGGATPDQRGAAKRFADGKRLDMVLIDRAPAGPAERPLLFTLGIDFYGQRSWRYRSTLWRPEDASPACFVPEAESKHVFFRIENGRLFCIEGCPWRDLLDRERGFEAARRGLERLVEGR